MTAPDDRYDDRPDPRAACGGPCCGGSVPYPGDWDYEPLPVTHPMDRCGRADDDDHDDAACADEPCGAGADPFGRTAADWALHAE